MIQKTQSKKMADLMFYDFSLMLTLVHASKSLKYLLQLWVNIYDFDVRVKGKAEWDESGVCCVCVCERSGPHRDVFFFLIRDYTEIFSPPNENTIGHESSDPVHQWHILGSCGLMLPRLSVMRRSVEWCDVIQRSIQRFHWKSVW